MKDKSGLGFGIVGCGTIGQFHAAAIAALAEAIATDPGSIRWHLRYSPYRTIQIKSLED